MSWLFKHADLNSSFKNWKKKKEMKYSYVRWLLVVYRFLFLREFFDIGGRGSFLWTIAWEHYCEDFITYWFEDTSKTDG